MTKPDDVDCWGNSNPVCPHCGETFDLGRHDRSMDVSYEDGGHSEWECDSCGKTFVSVTSVRYYYHTAINEECASDELWGHRECAE